MGCSLHSKTFYKSARTCSKLTARHVLDNHVLLVDNLPSGIFPLLVLWTTSTNQNEAFLFTSTSLADKSTRTFHPCRRLSRAHFPATGFLSESEVDLAHPYSSWRPGPIRTKRLCLLQSRWLIFYANFPTCAVPIARIALRKVFFQRRKWACPMALLWDFAL